MKRTITDGEIYQTLAAMTSSQQDGVLATVVRTRLSTPGHEGGKMIVHPDGSVTGTVGGGRSEARVIEEALKVFEDRRCRLLELDLAKGLGVCGGCMEVFLEPVLRSNPFLIIGAGHVGRALIQLGKTLPFHFILVDDRPEFLEPWHEDPTVKTLLAGPDQVGELLEVNNRSALLLASRTHQLDAAYLAAVLGKEKEVQCQYPFLGVLGSRSKSARLRKIVGEKDPSFGSRLGEIQMPVGLDIGADTPSEIALSIFAEVLGLLRGVPQVCDADGKTLGLPWHRNRSPKATNSSHGRSE